MDRAHGGLQEILTASLQEELERRLRIFYMDAAKPVIYDMVNQTLSEFETRVNLEKDYASLTETVRVIISDRRDSEK